MRFGSKRVSAGLIGRVKGLRQDMLAQIERGELVSAEEFEAVSAWLVSRYEGRIRSKLDDIGLTVPEGEPVTIEAVRGAVMRRTELEIKSLDKRGIMDAIDKLAAAELSRALGLEVSTVFDREQLLSEVKAGVIDLLLGGGKAGFLKGVNLDRLRAAATYSNSGLSGVEIEQAKNRYYQRRYRRTHAQKYI